MPVSENELSIDDEREAALESQLDPGRLPRHIAIIMDGNGRWAREKGLRERIRGHEAGADSVKAVTEKCARLGIQALTLYAFSRENWARPKAETSALMHLLERFLKQERETIEKNNIRMRAIGCLEDLPKGARRKLEELIERTRENTGLSLCLALSYSGREEISNAARKLARKAKSGEMEPDAIDIEAFGRELYAPDLGDPDLLIRTSGEMRVSNFLLWQIAYAEIHVTPVFWPDFRETQLLEALIDYQSRDRRFGKVKSE
ncbi:MAG: isoprenyl transferase [Candidatus Sumerlaeota bacterium]